VLAGQVVRVVTTGGGGWGDPLEREPDWVQRDVIEGKVSLAAARDDYGVVLREADGKDPFVIDEAGTAALRAKLKAARRSAPPMIDRGDGFEKMMRGEVKPWVRST
jgi:N-methylhydantoinase B